MSEPDTELAVKLVNRLEEIERLSTVIEAFGATHQIPDAVIFAFNLSLDEVIANVILYAFPDVQEHAIDVRLRLDAGVLTAEVVDAGRPFNPLDIPPPNLDAPIEDRRIGGLGIHIVREMMDGLEYKREQGRNILRLSKRVG